MGSARSASMTWSKALIVFGPRMKSILAMQFNARASEFCALYAVNLGFLQVERIAVPIALALVGTEAGHAFGCESPLHFFAGSSDVHGLPDVEWLLPSQ